MCNKIKKAYGIMSENARSGLWYTICSIIQKGISFITVPIFTRLMTTEQYGTVSVYYSWEAVLVAFCTLNLFSGVFNNGMIKYENERSKFLSALQGLVTTLTVGLFCGYLIIRDKVNNWLGLSTPLIIIMFLEILSNAAFSFWTARERFEIRYKKMVAITLSVSAIAPLMALVAIWLTPERENVYARIFAGAGVVIFVYGIVYILNFVKGRTFFDKTYWKYGLTFNIPLLPHYLSTLILNQSDRIMISKMVGLSQAGIYSLSHNLAMILNVLTTSVNNAFAPWLYVKLKDKDYCDISGTGNAMFLLIAIALLFLILFAPEIVWLMGGKEYMNAIYIIPPLTVSIYFMFMYQIFANIEFYYEENIFIMCASVIGAALNIVLNMIFIKLFGYIAAGYTTLVCYIIFGTAHYNFMQRTIRKNISNVSKLFDNKFIFGLAVILVTLAGLILFTYKFKLLRYGVTLLAVIICIIKRKQLINIIKIVIRRK